MEIVCFYVHIFVELAAEVIQSQKQCGGASEFAVKVVCPPWPLVGVTMRL
jgi:cytochrome c551/c552